MSNKDKKKKKIEKQLKKLNKKSKKRFKTRKDKISKGIHPAFKKMWFNNDKEKIDVFSQWYLRESDDMRECADDLLVGNNDALNNELKKLESIPIKNGIGILNFLDERRKLIKRYKRRELSYMQDLSLTALMDPTLYSKKFHNVSDYRDHLKSLAKREREELKEKQRQGHITELSLEAIEARIASGRSCKDIILSDEFTIKYKV